MLIQKDMGVAANQFAAPKNHLLEALSARDLMRLESKLEPVSYELSDILYEPNKRMEYAYFPTTAIVSLLYIMENGSTSAVSMIGNDGIVGIAHVMEVETVPNEAIVQCAGELLRIKYWDLQRELKRGGVLSTLLLRFTMALLEQTSQTAVCNRFHSTEMQLCRWLLHTHDRLSSDSLEITHELISKILGISREGITHAIKKLKERGLIENARGTITIVDRWRMEMTVCECYKRVNAEYNRLLGRGISRTFR